MFVGIGVTDPDVAAFLTQTTSQLPTALFWDSHPSLSSSSRVDGYAPAAAGPLSKLLAQHVGFSREAKAAEVMKTLDILWSRDTSGELCTSVKTLSGFSGYRLGAGDKGVSACSRAASNVP